MKTLAWPALAAVALMGSVSIAGANELSVVGTGPDLTAARTRAS